MDGEESKLGGGIRGSLRPSSRNRDGNVSDPARIVAGEGEDIGGGIGVAVNAVELTELTVVGEPQRNSGARRHTERISGTPQERAERGMVEQGAIAGSESLAAMQGDAHLSA